MKTRYHRPAAPASGFRSLAAVVLATAVSITAQTAPLAAQGSEDPAPDPPATAVEGGEITVTAAIPELPTAERVSGERLRDSGEDDVAEAMRTLAGVAATRRGPINLDPQIRGLAETQVGVFVDGSSTTPAGPARMDSALSHVNRNDVASLNIVKGPYALIWGPGTMSAVEVELRRPRYSSSGLQWQGAAGGRYEENGDTSDLFASVGAGAERLRFSLFGGRRDGDDYETGGGALVPAGYESSNLRWHLGWAPAESFDLDWSSGYQEQGDIDYAGRLLDATYFYTRSHSLRASWIEPGPFDEVFAQVYANRKDHRMNNDAKPTAQAAPGRIPPFALRIDLPTESNTSGARLRARKRAGEVAWTFGTDYAEVEQTATRRIFRRADDRLLFQDAVWPDARLRNLGGYAQALWGGDKASFGGSLRLDRIEAEADGLSPFFVANTVGDPDQSDTEVSAALSATFALSDDWLLQLGAGRSVRGATTLERYSDRFPATRFQLPAEFMGNPLLRPEASQEANVGMSGRLAGIELRFDAFYRVIDDYITVAPDPSLPKRLPLSPPVVFRYVNGDQATFYGGELRLDQGLELSEGLRLVWRGELAYLRGEDETFDEPALGVAPAHAALGLRFYALRDRLWVDLEARTVDDQDRVASSRFETPTERYSLIHLHGRFELASGWALTVRGDNLTDRDYAPHLNAPNPFTRQRIAEPGRSFGVGIELRY